MHETFQLASVIYKEFMENPLSRELCDCITDDEVNGVMDELANIAQQLRSKQNNGKARKIPSFTYAGGYRPTRSSWTTTTSPWSSWTRWSSWSLCPLFLLLLVGSNFTVKGNTQDVTKVTGTITNKNITINNANHH